MKTKTISLLAIAALIACATNAADFDHTHAKLDRVLKAHVTNNALVNYSALKAAPQELEAYLGDLSSVTRSQFAVFTEPQQLAYLINLYNANTLKLIIDHYPVESIKKIGGLFGRPWSLKVVSLFGGKVSLDHIEHEMLRKDYNEPRIHFAIVCAALGCPSLRADAYTPEKLDDQLTEQGVRFLAESSKNRVNLANKTLHLSPIFKWFDEDFEKKSGTVQRFVTPYFPKPYHSHLNAAKFRIKYTDYDWSLNEAK